MQDWYRFAPGIDRDHYNAWSRNSDRSYEHRAVQNAWGLMNSFTKIEKGVARIITTGIGCSDDLEWKAVTYKIGKAFPFTAQIEMIEDLVRNGTFKLAKDDNIKLPRGLRGCKISFFRSLRLAMEFRNELAHTGIIYWVEKRGNGYVHFPILGFDNPRCNNPTDIFRPVDISEPSVINRETGEEVSLSFNDWVFRLSNELPPRLNGTMIEPTWKSVNPQEFFECHIARFERRLEKAKESNIKKAKAFVEYIMDVSAPPEKDNK